MKRTKLIFLITALVLGSCSLANPDEEPFRVPEGDIRLAFSVAADMRNFTTSSSDYFRGVCERLKTGGAGQFMISPGDIDPPSQALGLIRKYISQDYYWYPVAGNHEAETPADMAWLRDFNAGGAALPRIVNPGPAGGIETSYSFDYAQAHLVVLNEYYDGSTDSRIDGESSGDVGDALHSWLDADLTANTQPVVLVFGHEPAYPQPDDESGRVRHLGDSLDAHLVTRDRFWNTLSSHGVKAYICGHTHNYSKEKIGNVWQIDTGHARGTGDTGARSTFLMFYLLSDDTLWCYTYRLNLQTERYELTEQFSLN